MNLVITKTLRSSFTVKHGSQKATRLAITLSILLFVSVIISGWRYILGFLKGDKLNGLDVLLVILLVYSTVMMYEAISYSDNGEKTTILKIDSKESEIIDWDNLIDDFIFHEKINYNSGNLLSTIAGVAQETPDEVLYQQMQEDKEREEQVNAVVGGPEVDNMRSLLGLSDNNEQTTLPDKKMSLWEKKEKMKEGLKDKINDLFHT